MAKITHRRNGKLATSEAKRYVKSRYDPDMDAVVRLTRVIRSDGAVLTKYQYQMSNGKFSKGMGYRQLHPKGFMQRNPSYELRLLEAGYRLEAST